MASMVVAGCGGASSSNHIAVTKQQTTRSRVANQVSSNGDFHAATHSVMIFGAGDDATGDKSPYDLYEVFRRAPQENDTRAREVAKANGIFRRPDLVPSDPVYEDARLVAGTTSDGVYALPTTGQEICIGRFPNGGSGCQTPGPHGITIGFDDAEDGSSIFLYGLIGDDVRSVDAVMDGTEHRAELGENGYFAELPSARGQQLEKVVLHLRSGETQELTLP